MRDYVAAGGNAKRFLFHDPGRPGDTVLEISAGKHHRLYQELRKRFIGLGGWGTRTVPKITDEYRRDLAS